MKAAVLPDLRLGAEMKKLLLTPLLAILTGCVSYYYPYGEPQEGVRYVPADEYVDTLYYEDEVIDEYDYSDIYVSSPYYPWWSIDYFYLGSHHHHSGFSLGFSYGSPWYWNNHYSYYDPFFPTYHYSPWSYHYAPFRFSAWYSPFYDRPYRYFGGGHYFWRDRYDRHHGPRHRDRDRHAAYDRGRHDDNRSTLAPGRRHDRLRDEGGYANDDRRANERRRKGEDGPVGYGRDARRGGPGTDGLQRHTTVAGGAGSGQRGMEVRNRQERKPKPSRMEPVTGYRPDAGKPVVKLSPSSNGKASAPHRKPGQYRYSEKAATKAPSPRYPDNRAKPVARGITSSTQGTTTVRAPAERKTKGSRMTPTKPDAAVPGQRSPVVSYRPPTSQKQAGRVSNSRKPIASMGSISRRPAAAPQSPTRSPIAAGQGLQAPKAMTRPDPRREPPAHRQKARPAYTPAPRQQTRPPPQAATRPAARPEKPRAAKAAPRPSGKGGNKRGSGRKER